MTLTPSLARELQSDLMKAAHAARSSRGGRHISRNDWHTGADQIASIHGYASGTELISAIGYATQKPAKMASTPTLETQKTMSRDDFIDKLADELAQIILSRSDNRLLEDWREAQALNVTPRDMRHARKRLRERGWSENSRSGGFRFSPPPVQTVQEADPVPLLDATINHQLELLLDAHDSANHDEMMAELRRIATLLEKMAEYDVRIIQAIAGNSAALRRLIELWT